MATEKKNVEITETPVINSTIETNEPTGSIASLIGKDYDVIVKGLQSMSSWTSKNGMKILNVTFPEDTYVDGKPNGQRISLTVNTKLDQYLMANTEEELALAEDEQGYFKSKVTTVFTSAIQISAILKQIGEVQLANIVMNNPKSLLTILEGARISVFAKEYGVGDVEQNPFAAKLNDYEFEHKTIRYYPYDIVLGDGAKSLKKALIELVAREAMGL